MAGDGIDIGAVFQWSHDDSLGRVLVHDGDVVMYDGWWPHLDNWGLADLSVARRRKINYYVTLAATVTEKATLVGSAPLTEEERHLHRPDLPFAVAQLTDRSWADDAGTFNDVPAGDRLHTPRMYVSPFGPAGNHKTAVRLVADDGIAFTAAEVLRKVQPVQQPLLGQRSVVAGVGLYRSGLVRGLPAYYVWGAQSQLHTYLADYEERRRQPRT